MSLKIEIPFDESIFINKMMFRWDIANQKLKRTTIAMFIIWGVMNVIGILEGMKSGEYVSWQAVIGFFIFLYGLYLLIVLVRGKRKYRREVLKKAENYKKENLKSIYEFTDKTIHCVNGQNEFKLDWGIFQTYSIKDKYIFINANDSLEHSMIFNENELANELVDLKNILSVKLKMKLI